MTMTAGFNPLPPMPSQETFLLAGAACEMATNSGALLELARESFPLLDDAPSQPELRLRFWIDPAAGRPPGLRPPYLRGLGHLVFAGFDGENTLLMDLRERRVIGRFSPSAAADASFWKKLVFPLVVGVTGGSLGITALHCACVARDSQGIVLAGDSGAGKSTLSLALAQRNFAFISDEWTYFARRRNQLQAWGLVTPLKLLPDAAAFFPELRALEPAHASNGELAFEFDPAEVSGVHRASCCQPRWLVLLERRAEAGFRLMEISPDEAAARFEEGLLAEETPVLNSQRETIRSLLGLPSVRLRYGGSPQAVARALEQFCENG